VRSVLTPSDQARFDKLLAATGRTGDLTAWRRQVATNWGLFYIVDVVARTGVRVAAFYADYVPGHPRHWITRLADELVTGTI
jgi:hypothetical protein